ncbi:hypothetical protein Tco_0348016 [Tanacetum coccineum]
MSGRALGLGCDDNVEEGAYLGGVGGHSSEIDGGRACWRWMRWGGGWGVGVESAVVLGGEGGGILEKRGHLRHGLGCGGMVVGHGSNSECRGGRGLGNGLGSKCGVVRIRVWGVAKRGRLSTRHWMLCFVDWITACEGWDVIGVGVQRGCVSVLEGDRSFVIVVCRIVSYGAYFGCAGIGVIDGGCGRRRRLVTLSVVLTADDITALEDTDVLRRVQMCEKVWERQLCVFGPDYYWGLRMEGG